MVTRTKIAPLIVIVGETASGKSQLAIQLAQRFNGEIIAGDSRTIYKGMDIATAKPGPRERSLITHHLLDVASPSSPINVADFQKLAKKTIEDVYKRGKIPILVGGSGLYIDAVIFDYNFRDWEKPKDRKRYDRLTVEQLQAEIIEKGLDMPINAKNRRHLTRELESGGKKPSNTNIRNNTLIIGIKLSRDLVKDKIEKRVDQMFKDGLESEVIMLTDSFGWDIEPLRTIGYQEFKRYMSGQEEISTVKEKIIFATTRYAKRQRTWFMRNKHIHWINKRGQAVDLVTTFLNK